MSIFDKIKDLEAQIKDAETENEIEEQEAPVIEEDEPEDNADEQVVAADEPEATEETAQEEKEDKPSSEFYRLRRENAKLKKRLEENQPQAAEPAQRAEIEDPVLRELYLEKKIRDASNEFVALERPFAEAHADYEDISNQYKESVYNSLRIFNPRMSHEQLLQETATVILKKAGAYVGAGLDPIEELYNEAKDLGFRRREQQPQAAEPRQIKPSLAKVAENKRRNASVAAAGSSAKPEVSLSAAVKYKPHEWQALPNDVKKKLLAE